MTAYYNEIDPYAAQWLRNLIDAGHIAPGDVDERSIVDVQPDDLRGYTQAHFFAGIGGWSVALRLAGWDDDRPVWTGSCPCQPFSAAGAGKAADDGRHLWPAWFPLISKRRPPVVFGEQVEAAVGWGWLDAVYADLESEGYACGAAVLPACGIGAPHIRNRLWFVADANGPASERGTGSIPGAEATINSTRVIDGSIPDRSSNGGETGDMADAAGGRFGEFRNEAQPRSGGHSDGGIGLGGLGFSPGVRRSRIGKEPTHGELGQTGESVLADTERYGGRTDEPQRRSQGRIADWWASAELIECSDGKARPIEPGSFPLAHGVQRRTSKLRAYGNAIVPQVAAEFIMSTTVTSQDRGAQA
jgi:DNA (cytosine-5)-methyltransferase 1